MNAIASMSTTWLVLGAATLAALAETSVSTGPSTADAAGPTSQPTASTPAQPQLEAWIATLNQRFQRSENEQAKRAAAWKRAAAERQARWNACIGSRVQSCGPMPDSVP